MEFNLQQIQSQLFILSYSCFRSIFKNVSIMGKTKRKARYTCNVCNSILFGPKMFKDHFIESPNCATYRCQFCTFCCQDEITLKQHMSQKITCSKKRFASLDSGFVNHSSKFCDLKKVKSHKMKFPSDTEISEFSSEDQEIIYNQIISQITGSERLSFDINTKTINSVSNTVVESSNAKKKKLSSFSDFTSNVRNLSSVPNTTEVGLPHRSVSCFVDNQDYVIVSSNKTSYSKTLSNDLKTGQLFTEKCVTSANVPKNTTYVIPMNSTHVSIALQKVRAREQIINSDHCSANGFTENVEESAEDNTDHQINNSDDDNQQFENNILEEDGNKPFCKDINETLKHLRTMEKEMILTDKDLCLLDLMDIMIKSNCPRGLFDTIVSWVDKHKETISSCTLTKREKTVNSWFEKLYGTDFESKNRVPVKAQITLSSGRQASMTTMSLENAFIDMITSPNFVPEILNINPKDPRYPKDNDGLFYGEPNTGNWGRDRFDEMKNDPSKVYAPLTFFTDGLKIDKYGKHSIEAVLGCFLWYNHEHRQKEENWFSLGFVEDQKSFDRSNEYIREERYQDYHDMLSCVFDKL